MALLVVNTSWSHAEQPPSANELVVEASRLILSADSALTPEQAIRLLEEARRKLVLITEVHPSSHLAVRLATGQGIGTVSLAGVQEALKAATERCWDSLSLLCVARLTLDAVMSDEDDFRRADYLITVASAQMKAGAAEAAQATWKRATNIALSGSRSDMALPKIVAAQAAAGQFDTAVKTAEMIEGGYSRSVALLDIAAAQRKAGKAEEAQTIIDKSVAAAATIKEAVNRAEALIKVAEAQAAAGQFSAAVETAASIAHVDKRTEALLAVTSIQTKSGNVEAARTTIKRATDTAQTIRDPYGRARALIDVTSAYIDMEDEKAARATTGRAVAAVQSAPQPEGDSSRISASNFIRAFTLTAIATGQTKTGQSDAARQTLATALEAALAIEDVEYRLGRLLKIATAQAEAEDAEGVRETIAIAIKHFKSAKKERGLVFAFFRIQKIGSAPLAADQLTEVITIAKSPEVENVYEYALYSLVESLASKGKVSDVMEVLKSLDAGYRYRDMVLRQLVFSQVRATRFTEAIKTAQLIEDPSSRVEPLALITRAQTRSGQVEAARATIGLAIEAVRSSGDAGSLSLLDVAVAQAMAGLSGDAKDTLHDLLRNTGSAIRAGRYRDPSGPLRHILEVLVQMHDAALL